jgi:hypothetical protein
LLLVNPIFFKFLFKSVGLPDLGFSIAMGLNYRIVAVMLGGCLVHLLVSVAWLCLFTGKGVSTLVDFFW